MEIITLSIFLSLTITLVFDLLSSAAAETRNPRKNLVTAMRIVFFQIFICYFSRVLKNFGLLDRINIPTRPVKTYTSSNIRNTTSQFFRILRF
jgi:L-asparagine transporter-like permease